MNRLGRAGLMLTIGSIVGQLLWTGDFGWFVQQRMRLPLIGAVVILVVFGVWEALMGVRDERRDAASIRRPVGPAVGWLLVLPIVVLTAIAPTGLGAAAADRVDAFSPTRSTSDYPPLDRSGDAVTMRVVDFVDRALWDGSGSLEGVPVRVEGLVVNDDDIDDGFLLTRFLVSCCAADGIPLQIGVHGAAALPDDTWVSVDVIWRPPAIPYQETPTPWLVEADAVTLTVVPDPPNNAYESPY